MAEPLLAVAGLTKRYGAFVANSGIDFTVQPGEVHAVIGPNGAGKTTFIGQIGGELAPSAGRIVFEGRDVTEMTSYRRAALGLGRTFQITSIFRSFSALENVAIAAQALAGSSFGMWTPADRDAELNRMSHEALELVGLGARADEPCVALAHGEHRQLELAMALVNKPKLVLLDEPTAGMGPEESQQILALLRRLKGAQGMILVEHDMEVVFAISDRITVLVDGSVIASGRPDEIRANAAVRTAYLGS